MSYEAWRASFQSAEQAAKAAYGTGVQEYARAEAAERRADDLAAHVDAEKDRCKDLEHDLQTVTANLMAERNQHSEHGLALDKCQREKSELEAQLSAAEEHIRGFPSHKAINDRDRRIQTETLDELIDSLTEVGGEITINGIQGYRDALARGEP